MQSKNNLLDVLSILENNNIKLGQNWRRELSELINDIAWRENISSKDVLLKEEVQSILNNQKLSNPQKMEKIKQILITIRYPIFSKAEENYKKLLKELKISSKLKIVHTPFFEDEKVQVENVGKASEVEIAEAEQKIKKAELVKNALNLDFTSRLDDRQNNKRNANVEVKTRLVSKIFVDKDVENNEITKNVISKFPNISVEYVDDLKIGNKKFTKDDLIITRQKSSFIKKCPGTQMYACCDYYVLNVGIGCSFDCTYCFLHLYQNSPQIVYANTEDLIKEVREFCASRLFSRTHPPNNLLPSMEEKRNSKIVRIGSGEFVDSIGFDELTGINISLISQLSKIENLLLEIKSKSSNVDRLLDLEHNGRVVISFSVNPQEIIDSEEGNASSLNDRLEAAAKCQAAGYKIGFHFDPIIYYQGWEQDYKKVVDFIFQVIDAKSIAWISLGALRFNSGLKPIIQNKFPMSNIIYAEMVPGLDGKLRYFIAIRKKLFKTMVGYIRDHSKEVPVYLCMESKALAEEVGALPAFSMKRH